MKTDSYLNICILLQIFPWELKNAVTKMQLVITFNHWKKRTKLVFLLRKMFGLHLSDYFQVSLGSNVSKYITNKEFLIFILSPDICSFFAVPFLSQHASYKI